MPPKRPSFINVDELLPQVTVEQVAAFYGVHLPELRRVGDEIRCRCFLNCGQSHETGERAMAINATDPAKIWRCHHYGCGRGGNLISLCDYLKPGPHMEGRPRGERFKAIAADLRAIVEGTVPGTLAPTGSPSPAASSAPAAAKGERPADPPAVVNVPLAQSDNERARGLVELDRKFVVETATMNPKAASYFRRRPYLTADVCRAWRMGYLPRDGGGDRSGGTMRGKVVYPVLGMDGQVLIWFGRDPEYEDKHGQWLASGKQGAEPEKFHFVRGFHRGEELFGQHIFAAASDTAESPPVPAACRETGLVVVEGPNDVIRLSTLNQTAVGLMSNTVTGTQAGKIAALARQHAGGRVALMLDCDTQGENGARQALWEIAQQGVDVRLAWSRAMHGGKYADRQPESLSFDDWAALRARLAQ